MPEIPPLREGRNDWLRLRTLVMLRWLAIAGQLAALAAVTALYGIGLVTGAWCLVMVGLSAIVNFALIYLFPPTHRLTERQAALVLLFDLLQLLALVALTGGLTNPFALLILAPVTIAATVLRGRLAMAMAAVAMLGVAVIAVIHAPLVLANGSAMQTPLIFTQGFGAAIVIGIAFLGFYVFRVASEMRAMQDALLATQMALAREQKLTDLGGVVAAAAHELGTPLATIKLVSSELADDLDDPDQRADAELIRDQADRCREILRSMGRAGKDDRQMQRAPLGAVLREAAEPHLSRGKQVEFRLGPADGSVSREPTIRRSPEIIHGLRNLIQNAVDFSASTVWVDGEWTGDRVTIRIVDDGQGYPPQLLGRIGDPFMRGRDPRPADPRRPGYEGMGLGLFIAKTLLERTGAELSFANGTDPFLTMSERPNRSGAIVEAIWHSADLLVADSGELGENLPITG